MEKWFEIEIRIAPPLKEAIVHQLFEWGAEGVAEDEAEDDSLIRAYFAEEKRDIVEEEIEPFIARMATHFPGVGTGATQVQWNAIEDENWAESHKRFYPAQKLTRLFFLKPVWDKKTDVPEGMLPLLMEPGQAFGTGLHASTRLCIRLLEYFVEMHPRPEQIRALDVGTGTGILAMVLSKLGVDSVIATDNDPIAVETAIQNIEVNKCTNVELTDTPLEEIDGTFEILVSNILLETHRQLAPHYRRLVAPGGQLILSGLLAPQKTEIVEILQAQGFVLEASESSQDWIALAFTTHPDPHAS